MYHLLAVQNSSCILTANYLYTTTYRVPAIISCSCERDSLKFLTSSVRYEFGEATCLYIAASYCQVTIFFIFISTWKIVCARSVV